jgi:hypothetical protein
MKRTTNLIEMSSLYDDSAYIWFLDNEEFPSKVDYRSFSVNDDEWIKWSDENINIINANHRIRANDTHLKLKKVIGRLIKHNNVILSWTISEISKGKTEISNMQIIYSLEDTSFKLSDFDKELTSLKIAEDKKSRVYMVVKKAHGLDLQDFEIEIPLLDISENYGSVWAEKHEKLLEALTIKKRKGIALLHGLPGTGKSMYIRHLIATLCENRTVVYLPNQLIDCITDPGFIPLMAEYSGAILVIEDADEAIKARKNGGGTVDKLLNLADGILSDFLGMQIICTFNNDIATIDEALLRKGRLILKHQFEKLDIEAAQKLSNKLGFKSKIEESMTLAEIYNQDDRLSDIESTERNQIGFGR